MVKVETNCSNPHTSAMLMFPMTLASMKSRAQLLQATYARYQAMNAIVHGTTKFRYRRFSSAVAAMLTGNVVIYLFGLPWLAAKIDTGFEGTLEAGLYPFVFGDLLKLYLAGALLPGAWRLVQRFKG